MEKEDETAPILLELQPQRRTETDVVVSSNSYRDSEDEFTLDRHGKGVGCSSPWGLVKQFLKWIAVMKDAFGGPSVGFIMIFYGVNRGFEGTMKHLVTNYYWKDVLKMQPASTQSFKALSSIPWDLRPIYGLITDTFPIAGYQRWPYLVICGIAGFLCLWALAFAKLTPWTATFLMAAVALCNAFPDVVGDAALAQRSKLVPTLSSDLQSLAWGSLAAGGLVGCGVSGAAVHSLGPQHSYLLVSVSPLLLVIAALALPERRLPKTMLNFQFHALMHTLRLFGKTLQDPVLWKPALYIYLSQGSLCPDISEAMFFWLTDPVAGPGFGEEFMGLVIAVGKVAMIIGVFGYNRWLRHHTLRNMFLWPRVVSAFIGLLDIILVTRMNLKMHIPDQAFVLGDEALTDAISKLQVMPMFILSAQLCPTGIEATIFAFLMSVSTFGHTCGSWFGALLLKWLHVQRDDYNKLWVAVLIRSLMRLSPLLFLFLIPDCTVENIKPPSISLSNCSQTMEIEKDNELLDKVSVHDSN